MTDFTFDKSLGYQINRTALRFKLKLQRAFKENNYDLSAEHWAVLNCLWENSGISQTEIATRIAKDKTNLTRILDVMEKKDLITRRKHESDRRSYRIFPTQFAINIKDDLTEIASVINEKAMKSLKSTEKRDLIRILTTINNNLQEGN